MADKPEKVDRWWGQEKKPEMLGQRKHIRQ